ncbi:Retrovirus-related Pol polyprotein from transposon RE2 [Araneus ventricosus]|uniref:Retrovirus-related Pol polyprotein from transposon RE2 n=1 Tax=Araneus ventricosus TaxID=182803 RepID=A0A4Y2H2F0_ARAVE|nr:Retrovirus-related Pol polyprotein from transposon RE2 [Araneus ventricosus]
MYHPSNGSPRTANTWGQFAVHEKQEANRAATASHGELPRLPSRGKKKIAKTQRETKTEGEIDTRVPRGREARHTWRRCAPEGEEALNSPQADNWKEAIKEELNSLKKNETFDLVPVPETSNVIGSKCVFKIKYLPNGEIERYKARLCAKGFSQLEGVDFSETFSPTSKFDTIRVILAIAAQRRWQFIQIDIKT